MAEALLLTDVPRTSDSGTTAVRSTGDAPTSYTAWYVSIALLTAVANPAESTGSVTTAVDTRGTWSSCRASSGWIVPGMAALAELAIDPKATSVNNRSRRRKGSPTLLGVRNCVKRRRYVMLLPFWFWVVLSAAWGAGRHLAIASLYHAVVGTTASRLIIE